MTLLFVVTSVSRGGEPTVDDIARALQDWKRSWVTFRFKFERRNPGQIRKYSKDPKVRDAKSVDGYFDTYEWVIAGDGSRRQDTATFADGAQVRSLTRASRPRDSLFFETECSRRPDGSDALVSLTMTTYNPPAPAANGSQMASMRWQGPAHAMYNEARHEWVGDTLAAGIGSFEGVEEVDGVACVCLKVDSVRIWFDREHGFLPRRSDDPQDTWSATEFERLPNGLWLPARGTFRFQPEPEDETYFWHVVAVGVNEPVEQGLFDPPLPTVGTRVRDHRNARFYTVNEANTEPAAQPTEAAMPPVPEVGITTAERSFWELHWGPVLLSIPALCALGAGIWLSRR